MASRWKQKEHRRHSTWRQSLLFNSLLLLLPIFAAQIVWSAYTTNAITDPTSIEARTETESEIQTAFDALKVENGDERDAWAARIDETLKNREFSAAHGYLLAAPHMLSVRDSNAIDAAATAERSGSEDQRLARAALLFLPNDVRANYERVIAPPRPDIESGIAIEEDDPGETGPAEVEESDGKLEGAGNPDEAVELVASAGEANTALDTKRAFSILGDGADLSRRSQLWLAGEDVDDLQLRLRALGLIVASSDSNDRDAFVSAVSVLRGAQRANRLNERFERYIRTRVDDALPTVALRANLAEAIEPVLPTSQRAELVVNAYKTTINAEAMNRLTRDMTSISRLAELTSSTGAIRLVEQVSSPEDMRRILLITEAGGDRAVALSRELGPDVLELAQIGVKWSTGLVLQCMALMSLAMALIWTTLSALTRAESVRLR